MDDADQDEKTQILFLINICSDPVNNDHEYIRPGQRAELEAERAFAGASGSLDPALCEPVANYDHARQPA